MDLKEGKGEVRRQTANGEVLWGSLNPSWSFQEWQLGDGEGQLGEDKGHWIIGKEGKEDKQEENGIFINLSGQSYCSGVSLR